MLKQSYKWSIEINAHKQIYNNKNTLIFERQESLVVHRVELLLLCDTHLRQLAGLSGDNQVYRSSEAVQNARKRLYLIAKTYDANNKLDP